MSKLRIYELAKQINMSSKELINVLHKEFGIEAKNHMSVLEGEEAKIVMEYIEEITGKAAADTTKEDVVKKEETDELRKEEKVIPKIVEKLEEEEFEKEEKVKKKHKQPEKGKKPVPFRSERPEKKDEDDDIKTLIIPEQIKVSDFATKIKKPTAEIIKKLFLMGTVATINNEISFEDAEKIAEGYDIILEKEIVKEKEEILINDFEDEESELKFRPPVVTVMGHVDHGKTSLLDAIRSAKVTSTEAGGITQHIGAYTVDINDKKVVFLDTPGHEAFTAMRARGAQATDIAVLVVAADDGVMPQTIEAINHAKAANVPIIIAINKMDKAGANPDRVKQELSEYDLLAEDWGGDTICVPVSAKSKEGIDLLLEMILLVAELQDLKANPNRTAKGTVIEAKLDKGRGPVATVLVQKGTLKVGDSIVAGTASGKVRAMIDDKGRKVKKATPSIPVEVLGLSEVPNAGDMMFCVADEKTARQIADIAKDKEKAQLYSSTARVSLTDLFEQIQQGAVKDLNIIVKADVQGSVEAIKQSIEKISNDEVRVKVIHGGVGAIRESDIILASASNALVIGFNVRPDNMARAAAEKDKVDIRTYRVIYEAIDDITSAMKGMLEPKFEEQVTARLTVRQTYKVSNVGTIAGSYVDEGKINRNNDVRVIRDGVVVFEGKLGSLKRFKDDAKDVAAGYECGITIERFNDIKEGDVIESFTMKELERE